VSALPKVGETLPSLVIPVTATQIVAGAIASRDFQDVHHDKATALEKGSPDIFMNILTTNGLVGRFVTDWSGPAARIKSIAIRLGVPNYPGDEMTLTGTVSAVSDSGEIEVEVQGANSLGNHVVGTVVLDMSREGRA
jgi:acyl dehydratase